MSTSLILVKILFILFIGRSICIKNLDGEIVILNANNKDYNHHRAIIGDHNSVVKNKLNLKSNNQNQLKHIKDDSDHNKSTPKRRNIFVNNRQRVGNDFSTFELKPVYNLIDGVNDNEIAFDKVNNKFRKKPNHLFSIFTDDYYNVDEPEFLIKPKRNKKTLRIKLYNRANFNIAVNESENLLKLKSSRINNEKITSNFKGLAFDKKLLYLFTEYENDFYPIGSEIMLNKINKLKENQLKQLFITITKLIRFAHLRNIIVGFISPKVIYCNSELTECRINNLRYSINLNKKNVSIGDYTLNQLSKFTYIEEQNDLFFNDIAMLIQTFMFVDNRILNNYAESLMNKQFLHEKSDNWFEKYSSYLYFKNKPHSTSNLHTLIKQSCKKKVVESKNTISGFFAMFSRIPFCNDCTNNRKASNKVEYVCTPLHEFYLKWLNPKRERNFCDINYFLDELSNIAEEYFVQPAFLYGKKECYQNDNQDQNLKQKRKRKRNKIRNKASKKEMTSSINLEADIQPQDEPGYLGIINGKYRII